MLTRINRFLGHAQMAIIALFAIVIGLSLASPASAFVFTPDIVKTFFDAQFVFIALVWGVLQKYWPPLASWNNELIGWINTLLYMLSRLAGIGVAHAGVFDGLGGAAIAGGFTFLDTFFLGILHAKIARETYELVGRPLLESVFKLKKAVPKTAQQPA